eukprot:432552-Hanusia_phi.AAC.1
MSMSKSIIIMPARQPLTRDCIKNTPKVFRAPQGAMMVDSKSVRFVSALSALTCEMQTTGNVQ